MPLKTKDKLSLIFAAYFFVFLLIVSGAFVAIFHYILFHQITSSVATETSEVIKDHLTISDNSISIRRDSAGASLSEDLVEENSSAIIMDSNYKIIDSFGVFSFFGSQDQASVAPLVRLVQKTTLTGNPTEGSISWRGRNMYILVAPLKNGQAILGTIILGKSLAGAENAQDFLLGSLAVIGGIGLLGSFLIGNRMVATAFHPLRNLIQTMGSIDLDKLHQVPRARGHASDELVVLTSQFNEMIDRLKLMSEQQKEFISNASHELRTPLTRAITSLELLEKNHPAQAQETSKIQKDLFELNSLLEQLLILSRLRREFLGEKGQTEVLPVLKSVEEKLAQSLQSKNISLLSQIAGGTKVPISKEYLSILLTNLIGNAAKYSPSSSEISVKTIAFQNQVDLTVTDHGRGISQEALNRIFDRFFREREARQTASGEGIGLAIVKRICDLHGIAISVDSKLNSGSTFKLAFPKT